MANSVRIKASVDDQVSGPLAKIKDKFDTLGKSKGAQSILQGVGVGAGISAYNALGGAVDRVVGFVLDSAAAYREDQQSQAGLRAALQANIAGWNGNSDAIETVVAAREKLGFTDDEQRLSLARLVGITHDQTKALDLQREAMDLARLRGIDLASAGDIIGKVYGGNIGILARYGIVVQKGSTATQALAQIQKMAAGQADAYANTDQGKLLAAQIKVTEAQEKLGEALSKFETAVLPAVADALSTVVDVIVNVGQALGPYLGPILGAIGEAFGALGRLVGPVTDAIGALGRAIGDLGHGAAEALSPVARLNDALGSIPVPWHQATTSMSQDTDALLARFHDIPASVSDDARMTAVALARMGTSATDNATVITRAFGPIGPEVAARMKMAAAGVTSFANQSDAAIASWRASFRTGLFSGIDAARTARDKIDSAFNQLLDDIKHFGSRSQREAHDFGLLTGKALKDALHSKIPEVRSEAEGVQLAVLDELGQLVKHGDKIGKSGMQALRDGMASKNPEIARVSALIYNTVTGKLPKKHDGSTAGANTGQGVADGVNSKAGPNGPAALAARHLRSVIEANLPSTISTTVKVLVDYANAHIGGRATGGRIKPGEVAWVGEKGRELAFGDPSGGLIIPSGQSAALTAGGGGGGGFGGGGGSIQFVYAPTYSTASPAEAARFAQAAGPALLSYLRSRGYGVGR